jgi:hypothetical protein
MKLLFTATQSELKTYVESTYVNLILAFVVLNSGSDPIYVPSFLLALIKMEFVAVAVALEEYAVFRVR